MSRTKKNNLEPTTTKSKTKKSTKTKKKEDKIDAPKKTTRRKKKSEPVIATKVCRGCDKEKPLSEFNYWNKEKQTYMDICKECEKEKNKEKHERKREMLNELKSCGCVICKEKELCCLDFHHIDQEHKEFNMGSALNKTDKKIIEEAAKCVIVCANCHRKIHAGMINIFDYVSPNQYTYFRQLIKMSQANVAAQIMSNSTSGKKDTDDESDNDDNENG